jgi:hypothetical protein
VRQDDPLSPTLLNLVVDMLAIIIARDKENGQIEGVAPHLVDDSIIILYYVGLRLEVDIRAWNLELDLWYRMPAVWVLTQLELES